MVITRHKITIKRTTVPINENVNEELQWFCDSLGLFGNRDKDKSCFRMFVVLLKSVNKEEGLTSDQIAEKIGLSRGTVVHHLHKLMHSGLVVNHRNRYMLKVDNLNELVDDIEREILRTMDDLKKVADNIDERLKL